jgi:3-hydroxybutyrate dehydrogenase
MKLKDRSAIVTGAASGIGKEIALVFAREGARVAIADLNQAAAEATAKEIQTSGGRAIGVAMGQSSLRSIAGAGADAPATAASGAAAVIAARIPCRSAVGVGGQPGISTSTGITLATRPRLA